MLAYVMIYVIFIENIIAWIAISDFIMQLFMRIWNKYLCLKQLSFAFSTKR